MSDLTRHVVDVPNCKKLVVYVQGDLSKKDQKAAFMTVNDLAANHMTWVNYLEHPLMLDARDKAIFVHVVVPGQDDNDDDLADRQFPTMQQISEDLPTILDKFGIPLVIGIGEGAGANILLRFGINSPSRCNGLVLIHCNPENAGFMDHFKDKFINWKASTVPSSAEQYLIMHKFGNQLEQQMTDGGENTERLIKEYQARLKTTINPKNLRKYVDAYLKRSNLVDKLEKLSVEVLLIVGSKGTHVKEAEQMHQAISKSKDTKGASIIKLDDIGDPINEVPDKLAQSLLLFCKGQGVLTSVATTTDKQRTMSGSSQGSGRGLTRQRTMSMEEYDTPNLRRFSFSSIPPGLNSAAAAAGKDN